MSELETTNVKGEKLYLVVRDKCFSARRNPSMNGLCDATIRILCARGIKTREGMRRFLNPRLSDLHDPFLLDDMSVAVDRIVRAIERRERVLVVGDYDVDGVTSTSILIHFFRRIGLRCDFYIPTRDDGYGFSVNAIRVADRNNAQLVITVDNGITSVEEVEFAKQLGIDVIITDHHEPGDELPRAYAVVNPKRKGSKFGFCHLSGVGVAFNLLMALRRTLRKKGFFSAIEEPNLKDYLDVVALGTMADIVPLVDENRVFAKYGLSLGGRVARIYSLLKEISGVNGELDERKIGFVLAPRMNAAGRLSDASMVVDMFVNEDEEKVSSILRELEDINRERQRIQFEIIKDIERKVAGIRDGVLVLSDEGWHRGVIGVVASHVAMRFLKPTIVISRMDGVSVGSGRSIGDIDLLMLIRNSGEYLERFGGHKMAVGISIRNNMIDRFKEKINSEMEKIYGSFSYRRVLNVDCEANLSLFSVDFLKELSLFRPYGEENEEPTFLVKDCVVREEKPFLSRFRKILVSDGTAAQWVIVFDGSASLRVGDKYDFVITARFNNGFVSFAAKEILNPLGEEA